MVGARRLVELERLQLDNSRPVSEIRRRSIRQTDVALCHMQEKQPVAGPQHEHRYPPTCMQALLTTLASECALQCLHIVEMASLEFATAAAGTKFIPARTSLNHLQHLVNVLPESVITMSVLAPKVFFWQQVAHSCLRRTTDTRTGLQVRL